MKFIKPQIVILLGTCKVAQPYRLHHDSIQSADVTNGSRSSHQSLEHMPGKFTRFIQRLWISSVREPQFSNMIGSCVYLFGHLCCCGIDFYLRFCAKSSLYGNPCDFTAYTNMYINEVSGGFSHPSSFFHKMAYRSYLIRVLGSAFCLNSSVSEPHLSQLLLFSLRPCRSAIFITAFLWVCVSVLQKAFTQPLFHSPDMWHPTVSFLFIFPPCQT